ncbi:kinase-like protein [Polyporus arcularius HHB13444]|uniref:Kinase-like protein n=1 Tax=Polyporus arcularius HHB13444 TaxID=1314778 RepID=A0A5C3PSB9_9APHY|nr:kinase-like protein [Polyporus arcularius HHB13444]
MRTWNRGWHRRGDWAPARRVALCGVLARIPSSRIRTSLSLALVVLAPAVPAPPDVRAGCFPLYILDMANAVASSSRDRPARNRGSMHSLHDPTDGVVITNEVQYRSRSESVKHDTIRIINQYEFRLRVGKGQHGEVYLAEDSTKNYMEVAVKCVRRKNKTDRLKKLRRNADLPRTPHTPLVDQLGSTEHKIRKEIAIMKKLNHPHVVRLLEVIDDPLTDKIYMVMEYLGGGEIKWRTKSDNPLLRVDQTRRICRDVILGLEYLHYQGIIHRDIKPANLLWTADRRTVKISDFGVSTFSYAQRLAAAGNGNIKDDDTDPILMDESDLSKTAGTPMFLAPEIVYDASEEDVIGSSQTSPHSSSTLQLQTQLQTPRQRPQVTKAIDIWAFGVTLYGLLFGILPFNAKTEYEIYRVIRTQDWSVPETMGLDQLPTGGRYPGGIGRRPADYRSLPNTEGAQVMDLLSRLLEKNAEKRITLDEVKRHPWITRDLHSPEDWLRETRLTRYLQLEPTHAETDSAMSSVRFRWLPRIGNRIMSTLRNVKPQRSFRRPPRQHDDEKDDVGVHSEPHIVHLTRHQTTTGNPSHRRQHHGSVREKGKGRRPSRQELLRNKSTNDINAKPGKPFEPWAMWNNGATPGGPSKRKSTETGLQAQVRSRHRSGSIRPATRPPTANVLVRG